MEEPQVPTTEPPPTPEPSIKSFDDNWESEHNIRGPIPFKLRGETLWAVGAIALSDREEMQRARAEGSLTVGQMFDRFLYDDNSRSTFWELCSNRENPVADETLDKITDWLTEQWGGTTKGKSKPSAL